MQTLPGGIYPYLVSPVDDQGRVRRTVLESLVEDLITAGVHGLTPLGSTGEVLYLTRAQREEIVDTVVRAAGGRVPVVAGVAAVSTRDAVEQARAYHSLGAAGLVVMRQQAFPISEHAAAGYFRAVADAVACPIVLYSNPEVLGTDLSLDLLEELAEVPNIRYVKDATGKTGRILSITNRLGDRMGVFSASAHVPVLVFLLGGVGWMSGPACVVPRAAVELYRRVHAGDIPGALGLQREQWYLNEVFQKYSLAACIKAALTIRGYDVGDPLPPQQPVGPAALEQIGSALKRAEPAQGR